jgi:carbamoyltransferase
MKIFGINSGRAAPPRVDPDKVRQLADGGAALLSDGKISCAAIEERFTRARYSAGFRESGCACLAQGKIGLMDLDAVGHSTCCDIAWSDPDDVLDDIAESWKGIHPREHVYEALRGKVFTINHYESHAALAFVGSGFPKALVAVVDGMGNRQGAPGEFNITPDWWRGSFQRHAYYLCEWRNGRIRMEMIHEDSCGVDEIGLGEIYRSVTHFLGWSTYQHAGKTMALASYGDPERLGKAQLIDFVPPFSTRVPVPNLHDQPIKQIEDAIRLAGYPVPDMPTGQGSPDHPFLCDVAALVQQQLETALLRAIVGLAEKYCITDIAFGGGVAMNCVALGKLAATRPDLRLYVPPAPADTGQALGNALWLAYAATSPITERILPHPIISAALGVKYPQTEIDNAVSIFLEKNPDVTASRIDDPAALAVKIVNDLSEGKVVGLRQGRSEYGPRALGQASIIADPRSVEMHDRVNSYKRREQFRPFAPSILSEYVPDYFETDTPSPFMSFAGIIREEKHREVPAVVHVDGSARYQSVEPGLGVYRLLLETWHRHTGVPVLLNTSFNQNGEPIVETPVDALDCFERSGLPILVLENWYLQRNKH